MPATTLPHLYPAFRALLQEGLREDGYALDWTSLGLKRGRKSRAKIIAKATGVFYGEELARAAAAVSTEIGLPFTAKTRVVDGARVKPGTTVVEWSGDATGILALERPYLNLAGYLSGIGHIMFSHPFDTLKVRALIIDSNAIRINWCIKSIQKYG